jgi:hypothetical protein
MYQNTSRGRRRCFLTQGTSCVRICVSSVLFNVLFVAYMISPKYCHRLVGYIEEEAVKT